MGNQNVRNRLTSSHRSSTTDTLREKTIEKRFGTFLVFLPMKTWDPLCANFYTDFELLLYLISWSFTIRIWELAVSFSIDRKPIERIKIGYSYLFLAFAPFLLKRHIFLLTIKSFYDCNIVSCENALITHCLCLLNLAAFEWNHVFSFSNIGNHNIAFVVKIMFIGLNILSWKVKYSLVWFWIDT